MSVEFNLGDKIINEDLEYFALKVKDVREAIKLLKERLNRANKEDVVYEFDEIINSVFGEKLT